jgi:hypothetical protein
VTVDDFIAAQRKVINECGVIEYLPTLWVDTPKQVSVEILTDDLADNEIEAVARQWAQALASKHDYFLGFRAGLSQLKVIARVGGSRSEYVVALN